jgi:TP901 family phage tail tape measure protein
LSASIADLFVVLDSVTDPFSRGMKKAAADAEAESSRMSRALKTVGAVGVGLAVGVVGIGVASMESAAKFQSAMESIHTQAGVAQSQIGSLSNGVLGLAGQVGFAPTSLATALYHIESSFASVGITGPKALDLLKIAAEGAAVGHADLVDVTNALDAAIASGIPGVDNFSQAMGVLNSIVGSGDMTMQDLGNAFSTGALANVKSYGASITDVGAALAVFGDNNIRGQNAATDLRMSMMALQVPAKSASVLLQQMGMDAHTLGNTMSKGGLLPAIEQLHAGLTKLGYTSKTQGAALTELFGKKAGAGIVVLYDQLTRLESKYPDLSKGATNFADAWQATKGTVSQQLNEIKAEADSLGIRIGDVLLPELSKFIASGQSAVSQIVSGFSGSASVNVAMPKADFKHLGLNEIDSQVQAPLTAFQRLGQGAHTALLDVESFGRRLIPVGQDFAKFGLDLWQAGEKIVTALTPTVKLIGVGLFGALSLAGKAAANILGPAIKDFANFLAGHQELVRVFSEVILGGLILKMTILGGLNAAKGIIGLATAIVSFPLSQASQIGTAFTELKTALTGSEIANGEQAVQGLAGAFTNLKTAGSNVFDKILPDSNKLAGLAQAGQEVSNIQKAAENGGQLALFETDMQGIVQVAETAPEQLALFDTAILETGTAAATAETEASGLAASIGKFALSAGIIGAAVVGIGLLVTKLASLPSPAQQAAQAIDNAAAATQRAATGSAQSAAEAAKSIAGFMESLKQTPTPGIVNTVKGVDQQLAQLVTSGHADQAKRLVDQIAASLQKSGYDSTLAAQDLPQYEKALQGAGNAAQTADGQIQGMQDALQKQQAITQMNADFQNLTQTVKANGSVLFGNSQQAIANQQAFQQAAGDVLNYRQQQLNAHVPIQQATTDMLGQVKQLEQTGIAAGMTKGDVDKYLSSLQMLPSQIQTTITANTAPAENGLQRLLSTINSSGATVTVYENSSGTVFSGGTKAHALGGPFSAGETAWVGERGPELVTFGASGYVTPNNMLQPAALAGHGGGASGGAAVVNNYNFITQVAGNVLTEKRLVDLVRTQVLQFNGRNSVNGLSLTSA